ncbi:DUF559 domain-containing protein [Actinoplanes sp. NPDC051411]|uniref:endonuclease domain-containing protein n=1 Tax=Actinoplanes sp. NPDC051411 TaxID=3155522 RepID=UPI0034245DA6
MAQAWTDLPLDRPISLRYLGSGELEFSAENGGGTGPAVVTCDVPPRGRPAQIVTDFLTHLDAVARALYPAWLPAAEPIDDPAGAGVAAVRSIALRDAERAGQYGPFLADLAERALRRRPPAQRGFSPEVRAYGLAGAVANSFGRDRMALLVRVPIGLAADEEQSLAFAARWLTDHGRCGAWFTGAALTSVDTVETVHVEPVNAAARTGGRFSAAAGKPHPASTAERLLETALAANEWACDREWNQLHRPHPLTNPVRVDLMWRADRCIVEIDGAEHREATKFAADRQRDVLLQLGGYAVLRFTNDQVIQHRDLVVSQIRQFLDGRRAENLEGVIHA